MPKPLQPMLKQAIAELRASYPERRIWREVLAQSAGQLRQRTYRADVLQPPRRGLIARRDTVTSRGGGLVIHSPNRGPGKWSLWVRHRRAAVTQMGSHVLGLSHVNNNDQLMIRNGTSNITNPPPDLIASEVTEAKKSANQKSCRIRQEGQEGQTGEQG